MSGEGTLPAGWSTECLGDLDVEIFDGPFGSNLKTIDYVKSGIRVIRLENIGYGHFIDEKRSFVSEEKYNDVRKHTVIPGDIVFSSFVTEAIRSALVPTYIPFAVNKADCFGIRFFGKTASAKFVQLFLQSRNAFKQIERMIHGVGRPRINTSQLKELVVPIAPKQEQARIISKIEELFSQLDKGIVSLTTAREQLNAYRQSVLKHAFQGKLTEGWRARHASKAGAHELEAALQSKRITGVQQDGKRELPKEWGYFRVDSLCSVVRGGSPRPAGDPKYYGGSIPFLKVADLTRTPGMRLATHTFTITEAGLFKTRMTPPNTLLISNSGATLGVPKICTFETTFNDGIAAFLELPEDYLEYFYFFWESKTSELRNIDQGAAQPNLNTSLLGETLVPMCAKAEAREIVTLLEGTLSTVEHLSAEIEDRLQESLALRQSILKKAFSGQLVTQDPTDESASVLLERIRVERNAAMTKSQHKTKRSRNGKKRDKAA